MATYWENSCSFGEGRGRRDFQWELHNFEKKGSDSPIIYRIVMPLIHWWVINFAVYFHVQFPSRASNLPSLGHGTLIPRDLDKIVVYYPCKHTLKKN